MRHLWFQLCIGRERLSLAGQIRAIELGGAAGRRLLHAPSWEAIAAGVPVSFDVLASAARAAASAGKKRKSLTLPFSAKEPSPERECYVVDSGWEEDLMTRLGAVVVAASLFAPLPALAYTQADADACTPDAFRLCQQAIPDVSRVTACLTAKHRQLSPPCMNVFNRMRNEHTASSRTLDAQARPMAIHPAKF